ncbi:MAG: NAD-dependent epimerase/dehydratase family protein [Steroidobacteraceae bacterium]
MRIFIAGASGALGRHLVPILLRGSHEVVGTARTEQKAESIRRQGAAAVIMDGLDPRSVGSAVRGAGPDIIVHEMTQLSGVSDLRRFEAVFAVSNRLRTEGLEHLIKAGREAGARRIIAQSFCGWPYRRTGSDVKSEDDPLDDDPPRQMRTTLEAIRHLEDRLAGLSAMDGVALRYGGLYGRNTGLFEPSYVEQVKRRKLPVIGSGNGWWSFVHVADAAAATAGFVEKGAPGVYNVVDDDPAPVRTWLPQLAKMLGARAPMRVPAWLARFVAGEHIVNMMTEVRAGSNRKVKCEIGWEPQYGSWRDGFAKVIAGQD